MYNYILRRPPSVLDAPDDADALILRDTHILVNAYPPCSIDSNIIVMLYLILLLQCMNLRMDRDVVSVAVVQLMRVRI